VLDKLFAIRRGRNNSVAEARQHGLIILAHVDFVVGNRNSQ
jgi:hypothetical protein